MKNLNWNTGIISFSSLIIIFSGYYLYTQLDSLSLIIILISSIFFFNLFNFILNGFKLSNFFFIKILQIIIFIIFFFLLFCYCSGSFPFEFTQIHYDTSGSVAEVTSTTENQSKEYYNFKLRKDMVDSALTGVGNILRDGISGIAPNLGVGAAVGSAATAAIKATAGLPAGQRLAFTGAMAFSTAAGTKIGLDMASSLSKGLNLANAIKSSNHANPDINRVPSPDPFFVNSPLELNPTGEGTEEGNPLIELLEGLYNLNLLDFF